MRRRPRQMAPHGGRRARKDLLQRLQPKARTWRPARQIDARDRPLQRSPERIASEWVSRRGELVERIGRPGRIPPTATAAAQTARQREGSSARRPPSGLRPAIVRWREDAHRQPPADTTRPPAGSSPAGPQARQGAADSGSRRSRRRRGRERPERVRWRAAAAVQAARGELQGGGQEAQYQGELVTVSGLFDLRDEGYGFLRADGYLPSARDVYVSISQARRFSLRKGDFVEGACRPAASNEKFPALIRIDSVSGLTPDEARNRPRSSRT